MRLLASNALLQGQMEPSNQNSTRLSEVTKVQIPSDPLVEF